MAVCHPNETGRPACYRRVTLYYEPLGALLEIRPLPAGVEEIRTELDDPYPIRRAIAALEEMRDHRISEDPDKAEIIRHSMEYAISVLKSVNHVREPQPTDPAKVARNAVRQFVGELADALENFAGSLRAIEDEDYYDRDRD